MSGLSDVIKARTLCALAFSSTFPRSTMNIEAARLQMIDQQVHTWDVFDEKVLAAMRDVPRERFVPAQWQGVAFVDSQVPLAHGQSMLPPKIHGRILQALEVKPGDVALEIGTGSGYLAACLSKLASRVRSIEIFPDLAEDARRRLLAASINNVSVETADAMQFSEENQFDVIAVTGSLPVNDLRFQRALKPGGRLFVIVGAGQVMEAFKITRVDELLWDRVGLFETVVDPLVNAITPSKFVF